MLKYSTLASASLLFVALLFVSNIRVSRGDESTKSTIESKLIQLLDSFEKKCKNQQVSFNKKKVELEFRTCFEPPLEQLLRVVETRDSNHDVVLVHVVEKLKTNNPLISRKEIEVLRRYLVEPICFFASSITDCFNPHYNLLVEKCMADHEGKAAQYSDQIIISACKNNGSRLIDFLESGGIDCIDTFTTRGMECLTNASISFSDAMEVRKDRRKSESMDELCSDLEKIHNCFTTSLKTCYKSEPVRIARSILEDVLSWTTGTCLKNSEKSFSFVSAAVGSVRVSYRMWLNLLLLLVSVQFSI